MELLAQVLDGTISVRRDRQVGVGLRPLALPALSVVDEVPERNVVSAVGEVEIAGAQGVPHRDRQGDLPESPIEGLQQ